MIDLHAHTIYSDGTWTAKELLIEAENRKLEILSITDHNSVKAYKEMDELNIKDYFSGRIIKGIEINTVFNGIRIEILAYDFDLDKMRDFLENEYNIKLTDEEYLKEYREIKQICRNKGIRIDDRDYSITDGYPFDILFNNIKQYPENRRFFEDTEWNNASSFFRNATTNKEFILYLDFSDKVPSLEKLSKIIRSFGGKVFAAHLFQYNIEDEISFLKLLVEKNVVDGLETYYYSFTAEETSVLEKFCKENNLLMSGGSDCHGDRKRERQLGIGLNNLNISKTIIDNWNIKNWYS